MYQRSVIIVHMELVPYKKRIFIFCYLIRNVERETTTTAVVAAAEKKMVRVILILGNSIRSLVLCTLFDFISCILFKAHTHTHTIAHDSTR